MIIITTNKKPRKNVAFYYMYYELLELDYTNNVTGFSNKVFNVCKNAAP